MDNYIRINTTTKAATRDIKILGIAGESNYDRLIFVLDSPMEGEAILEVAKLWKNIDGKIEYGSKYFSLEKNTDGNFYFDIKNSFLDVEDDNVSLQFTLSNGTIIFKSKILENNKILQAIEATSTIEEEYPNIIEIILGYKTAAETAKNDTITAKNSVDTTKSEIENIKTNIDNTAVEIETKRQEVATNTTSVATDKQTVENDKTIVNQTYNDFLNQIGNEVATLDPNGKIPLSQIPSTATVEIYTILNESELIGLNAQKGDLAELIEIIDGKQTIVKAWQLLTNDPTIASNWVIWGTSYAVQSGNATHADSATDSTKINGKRLIEMTQADYDNAVIAGTLTDDTYYLVTPI